MREGPSRLQRVVWSFAIIRKQAGAPGGGGGGDVSAVDPRRGEKPSGYRSDRTGAGKVHGCCAFSCGLRPDGWRIHSRGLDLRDFRHRGRNAPSGRYRALQCEGRSCSLIQSSNNIRIGPPRMPRLTEGDRRRKAADVHGRDFVSRWKPEAGGTVDWGTRALRTRGLSGRAEATDFVAAALLKGTPRLLFFGRGANSLDFPFRRGEGVQAAIDGSCGERTTSVTSPTVLNTTQGRSPHCARTRRMVGFDSHFAAARNMPGTYGTLWDVPDALLRDGMWREGASAAAGPEGGRCLGCPGLALRWPGK